MSSGSRAPAVGRLRWVLLIMSPELFQSPTDVLVGRAGPRSEMKGSVWEAMPVVWAGVRHSRTGRGLALTAPLFLAW